MRLLSASVFLLLCISLPCLVSRDAACAEESVDRATQACDQLLARHSSTHQDLSLELVRMARQFQAALPTERRISLYVAATEGLLRSEADLENQALRATIRNKAVSELLSAGDIETAEAVLREAFRESLALEQRLAVQPETQLLQMTRQLAYSDLVAGKADRSERLYGWALQYHESFSIDDRSSEAKMRLGIAWASAVSANQPSDSASESTDRYEIAAGRLHQFSTRFPDHPDAANAAAMRVNCYRRALEASALEASALEASALEASALEASGVSATQQTLTSAGIAVLETLKQWGDSSQSTRVVLDALAIDTKTSPAASPADPIGIQTAVIDWVASQANLENISLELTSKLLAQLGDQLPAKETDRLLNHLASHDDHGQMTAQLLNELDWKDGSSLSEQFAARLISQQNAMPMVCESACRWAGRTKRWSMLALAAQSIDLSKPFDRRTLHVDRLFAEALTQTQQTELAAKWWAHLVDTRQADDFATLLRCAETSVAHASVADARMRVSQLRTALEMLDEMLDNAAVGAKPMLVNLIEADLAIREIDFDRARSLFESVVRAPSSTNSLRGRSQWMIGECHFMQQQFALAIDAYRLVEGLDSESPFIVASLVQAGKAFEQLGRTQDAAVCYGTVLSRFAESRYAEQASRRMADLGNRNSKEPSLRR